MSTTSNTTPRKQENLFSFNPDDPCLPDPKGYFGAFGGQYVPDAALPILNDLAEAFNQFSQDPVFIAEFNDLLQN